MENKKVVLITGASGGLGKAIIPILSSRGYTLALQARSRVSELESWVASLGISDVHVFKQELSDEASCLSLVENVERSVGQINYLLNNAGINATGSAHKLKANDFDAVLEINLNVPFYLSAAVSLGMIDRGFGRIIHMSSVVAKLPVAGTVAYAASKAGLMGMARAQAADWARFGITVNCIAPGYMDKGMIEQVPEKIREGLMQQIPARKLGNAEEIGELIAYLFSESSSYVNGQTLGINGGLL